MKDYTGGRFDAVTRGGAVDLPMDRSMATKSGLLAAKSSAGKPDVRSAAKIRKGNLDLGSPVGETPGRPSGIIPAKPMPDASPMAAASGNQMAERQKEEKALGFDRKKGYTGD